MLLYPAGVVNSGAELRGRHDGFGTFGNPSGKNVEIMGISQYRIEEGKITAGWVLYDGLDVLRQIADVKGTEDLES